MTNILGFINFNYLLFTNDGLKAFALTVVNNYKFNYMHYFPLRKMNPNVHVFMGLVTSSADSLLIAQSGL